MCLNEEDYQQHISSLSLQQWAPLLDLIPVIQNTKVFRYVVEDRRNTTSYWTHSEVVDRFLYIAYRIPVVISFNWKAWDEGKAILKDENFDFNSVDIPTKCKLITTLLRKERFWEGTLPNAFETGCVLKILVSIRHQLYHQ